MFQNTLFHYKERKGKGKEGRGGKGKDKELVC